MAANWSGVGPGPDLEVQVGHSTATGPGPQDIYYMSTPNDKLGMRTAVYTLFMLEIIQIVALGSSGAFTMGFCIYSYAVCRIRDSVSAISIGISFAKLITATVSGSRWIDINDILLLHKVFGAISTMNATTLYFAFFVTISKLYTNSLYTTLNIWASFERDLKKDSCGPPCKRLSPKKDGGVAQRLLLSQDPSENQTGLS
ncbi:hypothetical protein K435DRAFT_801695 [Dendrothele bispora CBS 962.96]|uniref:Uncharacterized protein n=1 Tax=Dendrothele bispora (strain CBS 962.96) TaxID=1314807 RepID=A0A4S8LNC9_DENBC|nr:hypothetical protein K435DRAFT_801695 [Dendrothele bispora CBS 962.96]